MRGCTIPSTSARERTRAACTAGLQLQLLRLPVQVLASATICVQMGAVEFTDARTYARSSLQLTLSAHMALAHLRQRDSPHA
eukprot:6196509-Pleurochrysis_carterae.AAC.2